MRFSFDQLDPVFRSFYIETPDGVDPTTPYRLARIKWGISPENRMLTLSSGQSLRPDEVALYDYPHWNESPPDIRRVLEKGETFHAFPAIEEYGRATVSARVGILTRIAQRTRRFDVWMMHPTLQHALMSRLSRARINSVATSFRLGGMWSAYDRAKKALSSEGQARMLQAILENHYLHFKESYRVPPDRIYRYTCPMCRQDRDALAGDHEEGPFGRSLSLSDEPLDRMLFEQKAPYPITPPWTIPTSPE